MPKKAKKIKRSIEIANKTILGFEFLDDLYWVRWANGRAWKTIQMWLLSWETRMIRPWGLSLQVKMEMWQNHLCRKLMWASRDTMNSQATVHLPLLWNKDYDDTRGGSKCHVPTSCHDLYPRQLRSHFSLPCEIGKFSIWLSDMRKLGVYSQMTLPKLQIQ